MPNRTWSAALVATLVLALPGVARAEKTVDQYRYFRSLSIDLGGRMPTRDEIADFEQDGWNEDAWIDAHLAGPGYSERLRRIYNDALRLEVGTAFGYAQPANFLRRYSVLVAMPDGSQKLQWVYFRQGQRRSGATLKYDKGFCFDADDTGQDHPANRGAVPPDPTKAVPLATMQQRAVLTRPWWLYKDYRKPSPSQHYTSWADAQPRYRPDGFLKDADGSDVTGVWVCKDETQTTPNVEITLRGVKTVVDCGTTSGMSSPLCGCGQGLERCMPTMGVGPDNSAFILPKRTPLGPEQPFVQGGADRQSQWWRQAWIEEAQHVFDRVFSEDRDFRELLTGRWGMVNGPLAQLYRGVVSGNCCGDQVALGDAKYATPDPLVNPSAIPSDLLPHEMDRWVVVDDRGPHASGILTLPVFLAKFGTRRAKANVLYRAFLCRDFTAENLNLQPSTEPNLMIRPGCATCHAKLEPLSAYFARIKESTFTWIPTPIDNPSCAVQSNGLLPTGCSSYYDVSFSTGQAGKLRGAYASAENVEKGPAGMADWVINQPDFASCLTQNVAESFLGRSLDADDAPLRASLEKTVVDGGYRLRAMVRALVKADAYRRANNLTSDAWRDGGAR